MDALASPRITSNMDSVLPAQDACVPYIPLCVGISFVRWFPPSVLVIVHALLAPSRYVRGSLSLSVIRRFRVWCPCARVGSGLKERPARLCVGDPHSGKLYCIYLCSSPEAAAITTDKITLHLRLVPLSALVARLAPSYTLR